MNSYKTTLCGVLAIVGTLVSQFFPEVARYGAFLAALGSGLGLMFARDNNVTSEQAGAKPVLPVGVFKVAILFLLPALLFTGCMASRSDIVAVKSTVLGLDIAADASGTTPHVRLGLVRNYYQRIPTATNTVYAPIYTSHVDAEIGLTKQTAIEDYSSGK